MVERGQTRDSPAGTGVREGLCVTTEGHVAVAKGHVDVCGLLPLETAEAHSPCECLLFVLPLTVKGKEATLTVALMSVDPQRDRDMESFSDNPNSYSPR